MLSDKRLREEFGLSEGQIKCLKEMEESASHPEKEVRKTKKRQSFGTHDFSECLLEGYSAEDFVWNYFHNDDIEMPHLLIKFALLAQDLKNRLKQKEISFSKVAKELVFAWETILGVVAIIDPSDKESRDFVRDILDSIPD